MRTALIILGVLAMVGGALFGAGGLVLSGFQSAHYERLAGMRHVDVDNLDGKPRGWVEAHTIADPDAPESPVTHTDDAAFWLVRVEDVWTTESCTGSGSSRHCSPTTDTEIVSSKQSSKTLATISGDTVVRVPFDPDHVFAGDLVREEKSTKYEAGNERGKRTTEFVALPGRKVFLTGEFTRAGDHVEAKELPSESLIHKGTYRSNLAGAKKNKGIVRVIAVVPWIGTVIGLIVLVTGLRMKQRPRARRGLLAPTTATPSSPPDVLP